MGPRISVYEVRYRFGGHEQPGVTVITDTVESAMALVKNARAFEKYSFEIIEVRFVVNVELIDGRMRE